MNISNYSLIQVRKKIIYNFSIILKILKFLIFLVRTANIDKNFFEIPVLFTRYLVSKSSVATSFNSSFFQFCLFFYYLILRIQFHF